MSQSKTPQEPPKIEFPSRNYPIKVLGVGADDYATVIFDIVRVHAPECDFSRIQQRDSSKGSFRAITLFITATGVDQLENLHKDLTAHPYVRMVI